MGFATLSILLGTMGALSVLETLMPFRKRGSWRRDHLYANLGLTASTLALNFGLGLVATVGADLLRARGFGWFAGRDSVATFAAGIVALDLAAYVAHWLMHAMPGLWRVHRVHHADPLVDVTTAYRQHPLETLLRFAFMAASAWALGLPAAAIAVYRLLSALNALLEHANLRLWPPLDAALSLVVVTPDMHKVHHSRRPAETDSNYGNILAVFDRLCRTFTPSARATEVEYGLDGYDDVATHRLDALLRLPFREGAGVP